MLGLGLGAGSGALRAETILIPNGSFESPRTPFVNINIDAWQKSPKPEGYVEEGGFLWAQLTGLFVNTPAGSPDHLENCDGQQALWLFAVPEVALFQDYESIDWAHTTPTHAFDARYEVGKAYTLTVGVAGGGGNMLEGAAVELSLYYRDGASNQVVVAGTNVAFTREVFPTTTRLIDFEARVSTVRAHDPWAGQHMGVRLRSSIVDTNLSGGYWDLDHVRLESTLAPVLRLAAWTNSQFEFQLQGEPGLTFEILTTGDPGLALSDWTSLGTLTNFTGATWFTNSAVGVNRRYYRARQLP